MAEGEEGGEGREKVRGTGWGEEEEEERGVRTGRWREAEMLTRFFLPGIFYLFIFILIILGVFFFCFVFYFFSKKLFRLRAIRQTADPACASACSYRRSPSK